jgi:hypothetical protein
LWPWQRSGSTWTFSVIGPLMEFFPAAKCNPQNIQL